MKTETLELIAADFLKRINPVGDPEGWQYGPDEAYTETDTVELLQEKEDTVLSMVPEAYRRMIRSTDYHGEILAHRAAIGQTTFTPKLLPLVSGTMAVYVNFPKDTPWVSADRHDHRLKSSEFSVDDETGAVTIPSVREGDWVYASYHHRAAGSLRMFKRLALDLAVVQIARDTHLDMENYQIYSDLESNVYSTFKKMREKGDARLGIDLFDRVDTVVPLRSPGMMISW